MIFIPCVAAGIFGLMAATAQQSQPPTSPPNLVPYIWGLGGCLVLFLFATLTSIWKQSTRILYDPHLALEYTEMLVECFADGKNEDIAKKILWMHVPYGASWKIIPKFSQNVDDVLDIIDDIGFLVKGNQISDLVAHHYFFYWVQLYYISCKQYIEDKQLEEPSQWANIARLYKSLSHVEADQSHNLIMPVFTPVKMIARLTEELPEGFDLMPPFWSEQHKAISPKPPTS